jgi:hypothetical protein
MVETECRAFGIAIPNIVSIVDIAYIDRDPCYSLLLDVE